jgi:hypothetical protein
MKNDEKKTETKAYVQNSQILTAEEHKGYLFECWTEKFDVHLTDPLP